MGDFVMDAGADLAANGGMFQPAIRRLCLALAAAAPLAAAAQDPGVTLVAAPAFEAAADGLEGTVPVRQNGLWGLLDASGQWAVKPQYAAIGASGQGRLPVERGSLWGVIDASGRERTPFAFQAIGQIADWTPMRWKGQWWAVGPDGRPEGQPLPFDQLIGNDGTCMVGKAGGLPIAVSRGQTPASTMLKAEDAMRAPSEGFVPIVQDGLEGHLDCAWGTIIGGAVSAQAVRGFHQGLAARRGPRGWGFGSAFGNALEFGGTWAAAGDFSEGLAAVQEASGLWGFVDLTGHPVIAPAFDAVGPFRDGMAPARLGPAWGFIGRTGNWLVTPRFQAVKAASQGLAAVEIGGRWGVIAVSPARIGLQQLAAAAAALWPAPRQAPAPCTPRVLPPGTAILATPGGAPAQTLPPGQAWQVCLGDSRDGFVQVRNALGPLGWVAAQAPLTLR